MTSLALDVGDRRIGVAVSDPTGLLARPLAVITRKSNQLDSEKIRTLADQHQAALIVVGVPLTGNGDVGPQARKTLAFARYLRKKLALPVETWDERYTTAEAQREMIAMGIRRSRRRELLDAAAAAVILDDWLTAHRAPPAPPPV